MKKRGASEIRFIISEFQFENNQKHKYGCINKFIFCFQTYFRIKMECNDNNQNGVEN